MEHAEPTIAAHDLEVRWFDAWHADLDAALSLLPEMESCPHELYRELMQTSGPAAKRTALVTHRDEPVAVVGLRRDDKHWTPVTSWIVPGALFPLRREFLVSVLTSVELPLFVAWWRQDTHPPASPRFQELNCVPTRRLACAGDYEAFWRSTGILAEIRRARRRCERFTVVIDAPGALEWTLGNWSRKWGADTAELPDVGDRLVVGRYLQRRGLQATVSLMNGDRFAASGLVFVHGRDVVGQASFREPAYDRLGIGTRLLDATHSWAASAGYRKHDFGGGHDYKARWAPPEGQRWDFTIHPARWGLRPLMRVAWRTISKTLQPDPRG